MSVIAVNLNSTVLDRTGTIIRIRTVIWILPHKFQKCHNFERRTRCILPLCRTIQQYTVFICTQSVPAGFYRIRIKVRRRYHGKDLSCLRLHHHYRTFFLSQCLICRFLKVCIQCCHNRVSHIFFILEFILQLHQEILIRSQQVIILQRFDPGFALYAVTDHMCKYIAIRILSCLASVCCRIGLRKHIPVPIHNCSPGYSLCIRILSGIIRTSDDLLAFFYLKISDISQQYQKKRYEYISNSSEFFVSCALCLEPLLFALFGFFSLFAGHILPLDIPPHSPVGFSLLVTVLSSFSQYPLPRLLLKYTVPG